MVLGSRRVSFVAWLLAGALALASAAVQAQAPQAAPAPPQEPAAAPPPHASSPVRAPTPPHASAALINRPSVGRAAANPYSRRTHRDVDLGLPTPASRSNPNDYLIARHGYVGSFNSERLGPNWIAYKVTPESYGDPNAWLGRQPTAFRQDPKLPPHIRQPSGTDYAGSGYDRGHEKRQGDAPLRPGHEKPNEDTYLFTNIVPQAPNVNRGPWNHFEDYYRELSITRNKDVRIIVGNLFEGRQRHIGENRVAVPSHLFKIAVISDHGTTVEQMSPANTRVLAVLIPNSKSKVDGSDHFAKYVVPPAEIIRRSGFTGMLSQLPAAARDVFVDAAPTVERVEGGYRVGGEVVVDPLPPNQRNFIDATPEPAAIVRQPQP